MRNSIYSIKLCLIIFTLIFAKGLHAQKIVAEDTIPLWDKAQTCSFSADGSNYALLKSKDTLVLISYDTFFKRKYIAAYSISNKTNSYDLIGAGQTGNVITIIFSTKWHSHFTTLSFDIATRKFNTGNSFDLGDHIYVNWVSLNHKMNIITVKKNASILSLISIDSLGHISNIDIDMGDVLYLDNHSMTVHDAMVNQHTESMIKTLTMKKFLPGSYQSDLDAGNPCKFFYNDSTIYITININPAITQVFTLDLIHAKSSRADVPFVKNKAAVYDVYTANSFLVGRKLVTAFDYYDGLFVGIYDLDAKQYVHQWGGDEKSLDSFITSPLMDNVFKKEVTDTIKDWNKFHKKFYKTGYLSVSAGVGQIALSCIFD
jgi:hypothetical protein